MIANEIGDDILFTLTQANETIDTQQVITMFIVIKCIDEMPNIMQQSTDLK